MYGFTGAPVHRGSWLGLPDFGISEILQGKLTTTPSPTGLTMPNGTPANMPPINNNGGVNFGNILGATTNTPSGSGARPAGGGGGAPSAPSGNGFEGIINAADQARRDAIARATEAYNIGKNTYDTGMSTLSTRRGQFKDLFDETSGDILGGYEKNRGEAQASASGEATRTANALRALGLGGSAVVNAKGRQAQENSKTLGTIQEGRVASDRANKGNLDEQNLWADTQQSQLQNFLQQLGSQKAAAESGAGVDFQNILGNVTSQLGALQAARGGIDSYAANPVDISSFLNADATVGNPTLGGLSPVGAGGPVDNTNVNINPMDMLLKRQLAARGLLLNA